MATREDTRPTTHTEYEQEVARIAQQNINVSPVRACTQETRVVARMKAWHAIRSPARARVLACITNTIVPTTAQDSRCTAGGRARK